MYVDLTQKVTFRLVLPGARAADTENLLAQI